MKEKDEGSTSEAIQCQARLPGFVRCQNNLEEITLLNMTPNSCSERLLLISTLHDCTAICLLRLSSATRTLTLGGLIRA